MQRSRQTTAIPLLLVASLDLFLSILLSISANPRQTNSEITSAHLNLASLNNNLSVTLHKKGVKLALSSMGPFL